jgi:excinuclease ABC subunit B
MIMFHLQSQFSRVAEPVLKFMSIDERKVMIEELTEEMRKAAKDLDFERAAFLRDEVEKLKKSIPDRIDS